MRQSELTESMHWDKSRLSHQLTRMEGRGHIQRRPAGSKGVFVGVTAAGRKALASSRPIHAQAVRERLLLRLSVDQRAVLLTLRDLLLGNDED